MRNLELEVDGKLVKATVAHARGTLWVHMNGETFTFETQKSRSRRGGKGSSAALNPGEVAAPMPGKIIKILVNPGETVEAHQVLLVMEAMKMEYTLKAQADGKVAEVSCEPGQQVALGQVLVKMEVV